MKFWVKSRKFSLMSYPALGLSDVLCSVACQEKVGVLEKCDKYLLLVLSFFTVQYSSDTTVLSHVRRVAYVEGLCDKLHSVH